MEDPAFLPAREHLVEKLAESLVSPIPTGTPRHIHGAVFLAGKATAVIGMRRAGKTTFIHQIRRERLAGGFERERLPYLNFEDERLAGMQVDQLHFLIDEYYRRFPAFRGNQRVAWCFDEIQNVPGWERFVRRILDSENVDVFLSGSSAALLSRELATAMRGRAWDVVIHPFSFAEFLWYRGMPVPRRPGFLGAAERSALEKAFLDYLETGGFPEAQGLDPPTRFRLLLDYVDVALLRDVMERHGVTQLTGLRWLARHLLANAGGLFSVEKFYAALKSQGLHIGKDTVHELLSYLEDCFLVRTLWMEAASERQRMVNLRKAYPIDTGLIQLFDRTGRANLGHALETAVLIELERRRMSVTYVRTSHDREVDFLAREPGGREELIQVCADLSRRDTTEREIRALDEAGVAFPRATKRLLTLTAERRPPSAQTELQVQPAYEWLLDWPEASIGGEIPAPT